MHLTSLGIKRKLHYVAFRVYAHALSKTNGGSAPRAYAPYLFSWRMRNCLSQDANYFSGSQFIVWKVTCREFQAATYLECPLLISWRVFVTCFEFHVIWSTRRLYLITSWANLISPDHHWNWVRERLQIIIASTTWFRMGVIPSPCGIDMNRQVHV